MSETPPTEPQAGSNGASAPPLQSVAHYVKDLSFENPNAPQSLVQSREAPSIQVSANLEARGMAQGMYEIELSLNVTATREGNQLFQVELVYGGLFRLNGLAGEALHKACLVDCPQLLFPFARRIVADTTRDGGFMPLLIDPIDFARLYAERNGSRGSETPTA